MYQNILSKQALHIRFGDTQQSSEKKNVFGLKGEEEEKKVGKKKRKR